MIIRKAFIGDTAECSKWYPFALSKLKELKRGQKSFRPAPDVYIELKKGDHIGEILIMAERLEREAERRFLFIWVADVRTSEISVGRLIDGISVYFAKRKGEKLVSRRVDLDFVKLDWDNGKIDWLYGGAFQCARFDLANPDQFVAVFKRTEGDNYSKTGYITTVRFKLVKNPDGSMEIWEISRSEFSYPAYSYSSHELGTHVIELGIIHTYYEWEVNEIDYNVIDIYVKGDTIKYLGTKYKYHEWEDEELYSWGRVGTVPTYGEFGFVGYIGPAPTGHKWRYKDSVFFGSFDDIVFETERSADGWLSLYILGPADLAGIAGPSHDGTVSQSGEFLYYPKCILNENSFLYVRSAFDFKKTGATVVSGGKPVGWIGGSFSFATFYKSPIELKISSSDKLIDYGTEEMANYKVYVGATLTPIGWGEVKKIFADHSRYFSIIRENGKYSFTYNLRYNIRWSIGFLIFELEHFKYASVNSDYDFGNTPVFFLGVPEAGRNKPQKLEGISFVDFIDYFGGGGGLSWSEAPYFDGGFTILPLCELNFKDRLIYVATQKDMNSYGAWVWLLSGTIPFYAYWILMDYEYYLNHESYRVELFTYAKFLCDTVIIQKTGNKIYCNDTKLDRKIKLINW